MIDARIKWLPLLKKFSGSLFQLVEISVAPDEARPDAFVSCQITNQSGKQTYQLGRIDSGEKTFELFLPHNHVDTGHIFQLTVGEDKVNLQSMQKKIPKWHIYLVLHAHTDFGFTAPISEVAEIHNRNTDLALEYIDATRDREPGDRFKWTCEVTWQVQNYIKAAPRHKVDRLMKEVRNGNIDIAAMYSGALTEVFGHEQAARFFYYAAELRRKYNVDIHTAMLSDVPGCAWGMVPVMAKSGIKNFLISDNNFIAPFLIRTDLPRPFIWQGQDGSEVLAWYTDHPYYAYWEGKFYGLAESVEETRKKLPLKLIELQDSGYPFDELQLQYAFDNFNIDFRPADVVRQWNAEWEYPKITLSTASAFLDSIRAKHYPRLSKRKGDWNNWWDNVVTAYPGEMKISRNLHAELPVLQSLETLCRTAEDDISDGSVQYAKAYDDLHAFDEHTASGLVWDAKSADIQNKALKEGYAYVDDTRRTAEERMAAVSASLITALPADTAHDSVYFFNLSTSIRSEYYERRMKDLAGDWLLIDAVDGSIAGFVSDGLLRINIISIQPMSSKQYMLREGKDEVRGCEAVHGEGEPEIENQFYKIKVSKTGSLLSIYDKELSSELLDNDGPEFNRIAYYVNDTNGDIIMGTYTPGAYEGIPVGGRIVDLPEFRSEVNVIANESSVMREIQIKRYIKNGIFLKQRYVLSGVRSVYVENTFCGKFCENALITELRNTYPGRSGMLYIPMPFKLISAGIKYESTCGVIDPVNDQFKGSNFDYHAAQGWVSVFDEDCQINIASPDIPLFDAGEISLMKYRHSLSGNYAHVFFRLFQMGDWSSGVGAPYNMETDLTFSFIIDSSRFSKDKINEKGHRAGLPVNSPFVPVLVPQNKNRLVSGPHEFFPRVMPETVTVLIVKKDETGKGMIIRIRECIGRKTNVHMDIGFAGHSKVFRCNITEEPLEFLSAGERYLTWHIEPYSIETFLLLPDTQNETAGN